LLLFRCRDDTGRGVIDSCGNLPEYSVLCGIVDGDCFEACRARIPTPRVVQVCAFFDLPITRNAIISNA